MSVLTFALLGAGVGLGTYLTARALATRPTPIAAILLDLDRPRGPGLRDTADCANPPLGDLARRLAPLAGKPTPRLEQQLALTDRTPESHALAKVGGALTGLVAPLALAALMAGAGMTPPMGPIALVAIGATAAGFMAPDYLMRERAEARRRTFRHSLSSYLDLVNILLAGGAGIETALYAAADAGDGWAYATIRDQLRRARLTGRSPWDTFADLAARLGVHELAELAASVSLAGSHGARIRASLAAKADSLRGHQVAETEAQAEAATERMTVPVAVLLLGFLIFIAYPAITQITSVSTPHP